MDLKANPEAIYVFGDNMTGTGYAGQAADMRGEPNAFGIPTKWKPETNMTAYFSDADYPKIIAILDKKFEYLIKSLKENKVVVLPRDGIGTGFAQLDKKAPKIAKYIEDKFKELKEVK